MQQERSQVILTIKATRPSSGSVPVPGVSRDKLLNNNVCSSCPMGLRPGVPYIQVLPWLDANISTNVNEDVNRQQRKEFIFKWNKENEGLYNCCLLGK